MDPLSHEGKPKKNREVVDTFRRTLKVTNLSHSKGRLGIDYATQRSQGVGDLSHHSPYHTIKQYLN